MAHQFTTLRFMGGPLDGLDLRCPVSDVPVAACSPTFAYSVSDQEPRYHFYCRGCKRRFWYIGVEMECRGRLVLGGGK